MVKFIIISLILHLSFLFLVKIPRAESNSAFRELVHFQTDQVSETQGFQSADSLTQDNIDFMEQDEALKDLEDKKLPNQAGKNNEKSTTLWQEPVEEKKQDDDLSDSDRALANYLNILKERR